MSGATRTIQQPARSGSISATIGLAALVVATAAAFAVGVATAGRGTTQVAAPAPLYAPAVRDLGARDLGTIGAGEVMPKAGDAPVVQAPTGYHGFGNPARANHSNGSTPAAHGSFRLDLRPS